MKTPADIIPIFDFRDGQDCASIQGKTWGDLGLAWNSFRQMSLSGSHNQEEALQSLLSECQRKGWRVIAAALHNFAASVCIHNPRS